MSSGTVVTTMIIVLSFSPSLSAETLNQWTALRAMRGTYVSPKHCSIDLTLYCMSRQLRTSPLHCLYMTIFGP